VQDTRITAENKGLHYRALDDLFFQAEQRRQQGLAEVTLSVQILEVYNENLRDLLDPHATQGVRPVQPSPSPLSPFAPSSLRSVFCGQ